MATRRNYLLAGLGAGLQALPLAAFAQVSLNRKAASGVPSAAEAKPLEKLKIYIPAGAGGGWDQTGRQLGSAIQSAGLAKQLEYENKGGKGGTIGLADFVARHKGDPNALLVGGLVMIGALSLARTEALLKDVVPIARLTSDYMVLAVAGGSKITSFKDLAEALRSNVANVSFTGGSAGGVDHMLAAMLLRGLKVDVAGLKYLPTSSGKEALALLQSGQATVAISGYSEFKPSIEAKAILPLAVSSRKAIFGVPSLREQQVDTELANWRGVFASADTSPAQRETLRKLVVRATETAAWRQTLLDNNWVGTLLYGRELNNFLEFEQQMVSLVTTMLKLKS
jgi:putative tricarboxylic transport membrane protein